MKWIKIAFAWMHNMYKRHEWWKVHMRPKILVLNYVEIWDIRDWAWGQYESTKEQKFLELVDKIDRCKIAVKWYPFKS